MCQNKVQNVLLCVFVIEDNSRSFLPLLFGFLETKSFFCPHQTQKSAKQGINWPHRQCPFSATSVNYVTAGENNSDSFIGLVEKGPWQLLFEDGFNGASLLFMLRPYTELESLTGEDEPYNENCATGDGVISLRK